MIYVVRHGQTDWNVAGKTQGSIDIDGLCERYFGEFEGKQNCYFNNIKPNGKLKIPGTKNCELTKYNENEKINIMR